MSSQSLPWLHIPLPLADSPWPTPASLTLLACALSSVLQPFMSILHSLAPLPPCSEAEAVRMLQTVLLGVIICYLLHFSKGISYYEFENLESEMQ